MGNFWWSDPIQQRRFCVHGGIEMLCTGTEDSIGPSNDPAAVEPKGNHHWGAFATCFCWIVCSHTFIKFACDVKQWIKYIYIYICYVQTYKHKHVDLHEFLQNMAHRISSNHEVVLEGAVRSLGSSNPRLDGWVLDLADSGHDRSQFFLRPSTCFTEFFRQKHLWTFKNLRLLSKIFREMNQPHPADKPCRPLKLVARWAKLASIEVHWF